MYQLCAFADEANSSLAGQIQALKRNGINLLEIRNVDGVNIKDITIEDAKEIRKQLDQNGIKVFSIGSPIGKVKLTDDLDKHMDEARHIFQLANILGTDKIRMFSFFVDADKKSESKDIVVSRLRQLVEIAKEYNVICYNENEKDLYCSGVDEMCEILELVDGLKCIYDTANFLQVKEDIGYAIEKLALKADYIHIKDMSISSDCIVPAGEGDGRMEELLTICKDKNLTLTLEPHLCVFDGYANIDSHEMKNERVFASGDEAFDCATQALKKLLKKVGV